MSVWRVLVVDDSPTARALLRAILGADPDLEVVGEAGDGIEAVALAGQLRPSVIVMDIDMPKMDGFEATKRIMIDHPTPIVIVSGRDDAAKVEVSLQALRVGALTVAPKPVGPAHSSFRSDAARLVSLVKALADVKVVRRREREGPSQAAPGRRPDRSLDIVGVAASTGGPAALHRFLELLPTTMGVPVLVVQHIAPGFVDGLVSWLSKATSLPVCEAAHGQTARGGEVYIAPDGHHLEMEGTTIRLSDAPPVGGFRPSADVLFASLAASHGAGAAAVVLTGMGEDGLAGAAKVRTAGGLVLAQDADTSVVFGMPRAVIDAGLAHAASTVDELAFRIARLSPTKDGWR